MGTVTYKYEPNQTVWTITGGSCPSAIREGIVSYVRINITSGGSPSPNNTIVYNVILTGDNGSTEFLEADVFATLETVGSPPSGAALEYEIRLGIASTT